MTPILITLFVTAPILALGTWLYLRRRTLSPRKRIALAWLVFLFILFAGPAIFMMWQQEDATEGILATGRGGRRFLGQFLFLWVVGTLGTGVQLWRFCRSKGEL